ncbi:MAG: HAD-IA family hydrolase [Rhodobacterales bacterium]|nr:HAD-IA family hydrolase [Rhodobacterales bacterium]
MQIDAVVFDIGKVLIEWDPEGFFDRAVGEARRRALFETVDLYAMNDCVDMGSAMKPSTDALALEHPDFADEIAMWHDNWIDMASPAIDHSTRLLRALRAKGKRVFALTNFGVDRLELATRHYPFLGDFEARFVSGELEMMKPDPAIYAVLEGATKIDPTRILFTDDRPENIATAAARGWQTHLFEGPAGWAQSLVSNQLLTQSEAK